jgi:hypothetical protein
MQRASEFRARSAELVEVSRELRARVAELKRRLAAHSSILPKPSMRAVPLPVTTQSSRAR